MSEPTKEEIDVTSEHFNPLKALYATEKIIIPVPNAKVFDNLSMYESAYINKRITVNPFNNKGEGSAGDEKPSTSSKRRLQKALDEEVKFERKFLPNQGLFCV